tara:strand:+ start:980 stop:1303 length:324 start_codon:yes stop_codon:yes gene_type:complete
MSLDDIQKEVDDWAQQFEEPYWPPLAMVARLAEETGEVAREINDMYGPKKKKPTEETRELGDELIDVFFTITCIANREGINLREAWERVMEKKHYGRDNQRYERRGT